MNIIEELSNKLNECMDAYCNKNKLEEIQKAQEYAKVIFKAIGGDLEEYEPWFIELYVGNFNIAKGLWRRYRDEL